METSRNNGGRPRKHPDIRTAWAAASKAYRERQKWQLTKFKPLMSSASEDWFTPSEIYLPVLARLGRDAFDLDPCSPSRDGPIPALKRFTKEDDGLRQPWQGLVWCNPPYGREIRKWIDKAISEYQAGADIILLVPARTDTQWWHHLMDAGGRPEFLKGRIRFLRPDGTPGAASPFPSALVYLMHLPSNANSSRMDKGMASGRSR